MISYHNGSRHKRAFEGLFRSLSFFFHPTKIRLIHPQRIVSPSTVKPRKKRRNSNETKLLIKCLHFINFPLFCLVYDDNGREKRQEKCQTELFSSCDYQFTSYTSISHSLKPLESSQCTVESTFHNFLLFSSSRIFDYVKFLANVPFSLELSLNKFQ